MLRDWINEEYLDEQDLSDLQWKFAEGRPFEHIFLTDFLKAEKALELADALGKQEFFMKNSDLFQFKQTNDLASAEGFLKTFYEFLASSEFATFMQRLTGAHVRPSALQVSGTLYESTDYLLCHDDKIEDRKVAYILYLGDDFSLSDGGSFNLLSQAFERPHEVVRKYPPKFNGLLVFRVSEKSFHEVEEVVSEKKRYAIGGWLR